MLDDRGWERDELSVYQGREEAADGSADWAEHSGRTLVEMSCTRASAAAVANNIIDVYIRAGRVYYLE